MNKVIELGRLTRDPEMKYSTGENANAVARFGIAVSRRFKNSNGEYDADFLNCVAFGKTAEFIEKYFTKGSMIAIVGRLQSGSYVNKDGVTVYTTDIVVEEVDFAGTKTDNSVDNSSNNSVNNYVNVPDNVDDSGLPFN